MAVDRPHTFSSRLERLAGRGPFYVAIPAKVSHAIGRRGIVPVVAMVNGVAEVRASLVPCGGGRHQLRLNAATRKLANAIEGGRVAIVLGVDESPVADPAPDDLARALRDEGVFDAFGRLPVGKQNHIIRWIEEAAKEATREKRVAMAVEVALRAHEAAIDRGDRRRR